MADLLIFVSVVTGTASFIALFKPLPRIGLPTRKRAAVVWAASWVLAGIGVALTPEPTPEVAVAPEMDRTDGTEEPEPTIVSDRFALDWELEGDDLLLAVDTDLPDEGELSVSVSRTYLQAGSDAAYPRNYFHEFEPVSRWRQPRRISLDAAAWKADLAEHQAEIASLGSDMAFEIDRVEEHISIRAVLHSNQDDPRFGGRGNPNLSGSVVSQGLVEAEASVLFPLEGPPPPRRSTRVAWDALREGESYRLSEETPLMPERNPSDPLEAVGRMVSLPSGSVVQVITIDMQSSQPWYQVVLDGDERTTGWINSVALTGTVIDLVR